MTTDVTRTLFATAPGTPQGQIAPPLNAIPAGQCRPAYQIEPVEMTVFVDLEDDDSWDE